MSGTIEGGIKAAETNKKKYGQDFYRNIGSEGGKAGRGGGFAKTGLGSLAGQIGGIKSAHKRYGTPIDKDKLKTLERQLRLAKEIENNN